MFTRWLICFPKSLFLEMRPTDPYSAAARASSSIVSASEKRINGVRSPHALEDFQKFKAVYLRDIIIGNNNIGGGYRKPLQCFFYR